MSKNDRYAHLGGDEPQTEAEPQPDHSEDTVTVTLQTNDGEEREFHVETDLTLDELADAVQVRDDDRPSSPMLLKQLQSLNKLQRATIGLGVAVATAGAISISRRKTQSK